VAFQAGQTVTFTARANVPPRCFRPGSLLLGLHNQNLNNAADPASAPEAYKTSLAQTFPPGDFSTATPGSSITVAFAPMVIPASLERNDFYMILWAICVSWDGKSYGSGGTPVLKTLGTTVGVAQFRYACPGKASSARCSYQQVP